MEKQKPIGIKESFYTAQDIYINKTEIMVITDKVKDLFKIARTKLGAPIRSVQLTDDQMCDLLKVAIGDYAEVVQNWVIESQWLNLQGNQSLLKDPAQAAYALTIRSMDWSRDYSYWFSREVGLQQRGNYELKKDFFKIEQGKQVYIIPAGREINKVLFVTPSTTKAALYGTYGSLDMGFAGGFGQVATGVNNPLGVLGMYVGSVYDVALQSADLKYKNSLIRGDLAYEVTAGPNGTHLVHLLSVPGGRNGMGGIAADDSWGWAQLKDCYCWYTYYETDGSSSATTQCMIENKDDVLVTPDQVPLDDMQFELMNNPTQQIIRQLFIAECFITLALIRGTFDGTVRIPNSEMHLNFEIFLETGKADKERALTNLKERLDRMLPWNQMQHQAELSDNLMKVLQQKPMPFNFLVR